MIATWRGLAIAGGLALALVVLVILDVARGGQSTVIDRALVPGFDEARVTELVWERPGQPVLRALRAGSGWELRAPDRVPADPDAIGEVLAALRGARWHRRGDAPAMAATLTVVAGDGRRALGIAAPIAGTEQSWITVDGRGVVVDRWVARALDRARLELQIRRPLADAAGARTIAVAGATAGGAQLAVELEGRPRRRVRPGALLLVAPEVAGALERALHEVVVVRIPDGPLPGPALRIRVAGGSAPAAGIAIGLGGACPGAPGLVALSGDPGTGCIESGALAAIEAAAAALQQPPEAIVERRPAPIEPVRVVLADGAALDTQPPRIADAAADPVRVAELLAALAAPAEAARLPSTKPTAQIAATDRAGAAIALDLYAERVVARRGEPVALRPAPGAWQLLVRPSRAFRDPALWLEEPATITAIAIDGVTYRRGQVIGAWIREPAGPLDAARVEALATALAAPRAVGSADPGDAPLAVRHRVAIEVAPPAGAPIHHALELGAPRGASCPARAARDAIALPAALCAEIAALAGR